jgi:hypothetical protein
MWKTPVIVLNLQSHWIPETEQTVHHHDDITPKWEQSSHRNKIVPSRDEEFFKPPCSTRTEIKIAQTVIWSILLNYAYFSPLPQCFLYLNLKLMSALPRWAEILCVVHLPTWLCWLRPFPAFLSLFPSGFWSEWLDLTCWNPQSWVSDLEVWLQFCWANHKKIRTLGVSDS